MKKIMFHYFMLIGVFLGATGAMAAEEKFSCGPGYVLVSHSDVDDIDAAECQKLWCRDLETGDVMGSGDSPKAGYQLTTYPNELCDANGTCIECFGDRVWCKGEAPGIWNPEYGAYTYNGSDDGTRTSYRDGGCFMWRVPEEEKITCPDGQVAMKNSAGEWVCAAPTSGNIAGDRGSTIRRPATILRR